MKQKTKFKETEIGMIPEDWEVGKISDLVKVIGGFAIKSKDFTNTGVPVIKIKNIQSDGSVDVMDIQFISEDLFLKQKDIFKLDPGDFVIAMTGATIGKIGKLPQNFNKYMLNQRVATFISNSVFDKEFIFQIFRSNLVQTAIINNATGAAQANISSSEIENIKIPLPLENERKSIAKILSDLDSKIELNQQMNKTLEAIGQALFKRWFVDFEFPNEKGKPYKSSGGKMVDSELGGIPRGWVVSKIGSKLKTVLGGTPDRTKEEYWLNGTIPWINSGKVNEFRITEPTEYITQEALDNSATKLLPKRTTVIAITGATLGQVSLLEIESCANQSVVGVLETKEMPSEYIYFWVKSTIDKIISWQTGGAQQHINKDNINNSSLLIPDQRTILKYSKIVEPLFIQIRLNCFENLRLSQIRDSLLPRLMSGRIRVS